MANTNRTRLTKEKLEETIGILQDIIKVCESCKDSETYWMQACREAGLKPDKTRWLVLVLEKYRFNYVPLEETDDEDEIEAIIFDGYESFYRAVWGEKRIDKSTLPYDYKESVHYVLEQTGLSERESEVIKHHFGIGYDIPKTLEETGKLFGISRERTRGIGAKALRKCRNKDRADILRYGLWKYNVLEEERKARAEDEYAALMKEYEAIAEERKNRNRNRKIMGRNPLSEISVEELELSERARNRLRSKGILSLGQLLLFDEEDLLRIQGMGKRTVKEIQDCLELYMKEQFGRESAEKAKALGRGIFMIRVKESDRKQGVQFPDFEDMGDYQDSHIADLISTLGVNAMMGQTECEIGDSGIYITAEPTGHTKDAGMEDFKAASSEFLRLVKQALPKMGQEYQKLYTHYLEDYQKEGVCMPFYGRIL